MPDRANGAARRPTVAIVVKYFPPTRRISGIIGFLTVLLRAAAADLDIVVISHETASDERGEGLPGIRQRRVGRPFPIRAARAVAEERADAVVVVSGIYELAKAAVYFAPLAVGRRTHRVFLQATNVAEGGGPHVRRFLHRFDRVAGTSEHIVDALRRAGATTPVLLPPAVDVPEAPVPPDDARVHDIGFVNHVNQVKGADVAAAVIAAVQERRPGTTAVIAGTGELEGDVRALLGDAVEWRGWLPDAERDALLQRCRTVLLPFRTSVSVLGVSQTVLEALASRTLVIGSDTPAVNAAITDGENGVLLVDPEDVDRSATQVIEVLDDAERRAGLLEQGRRDAEQRWDVRHRTRELVDLVVPPDDRDPIIQFFLGTKAQYIKTAPLITACVERGVPFRLIDSGQHGTISGVMRAELGIPEPDVTLVAGGDITSVVQAARWASRIAVRLLRPQRVFDDVFGGRGGICVVHGDTPSTLLSALLARRAGLRVAHLEAGLRSFNVLHPFPEELIRIVVMRIADVLFTPNDEATGNLRAMDVRGEVIQLDGNTTHEPLRDALDLEDGADLPGRGPAIVTCHRVENLKKPQRLSMLVDVVRRLAEGGQRCIFVVHGPTRQTLAQRDLLGRLEHENIEVRDLVDHATFVRLLADAPYAIIDGGSIQEEAAVLGVPTLVWRSHTERPDGIGANAVLCEYDPEIVDRFIADPQRWRRPVAMPTSSPSVQALDILAARL